MDAAQVVQVLLQYTNNERKTGKRSTKAGTVEVNPGMGFFFFFFPV